MICSSLVVHYEKYDLSRYRTEADIVEYVRHLREMSRPAYKKPTGETWA